MATAQKTPPKRTGASRSSSQPSGKGNLFTRKIGPQPAWAWLTELGVAIYVWRRQQAAAGGGSSAGVPASPLDTGGGSGAGSAGGGGDSGSGGGGLSLPDMSTSPQPQQPVPQTIRFFFQGPPQTEATPPATTGVSTASSTTFRPPPISAPAGSGLATIQAEEGFGSTTTATKAQVAAAAKVGQTYLKSVAPTLKLGVTVPSASVGSTKTSSTKVATGAPKSSASGAGAVKTGTSKVNRQAKARAA